MPDEAQIITAEKLCALTGLTDRRHRQLAAEGHFPPPIKGRYQLAPTITGLFRYYREQQAKKTNTFAALRERKLKEEGDRLEMENARARGALVDVERVYAHFQGVYVAFRQKVLASTLLTEEKEEFLNDLARLKLRDIPIHRGPGGNSQPAPEHPSPASAP